MTSTKHPEAFTDFAAGKALAISQRGTYRDYVDMYFLLKEQHVDLTQIIELADKKFGEEFNHRLFLEQLLYLEDLREVQVDFLRDPVERDDIDKFLEGEVEKFRLIA